MAQGQVKTVTSTDFFHNVSAAKRAALEGDHVLITDRGEPTVALVPIALYRRLMNLEANPVDMLRMPEADGFEIDFETIHIHAKEIDA